MQCNAADGLFTKPSYLDIMAEKRCPYYEDIPVKSCNAVLEGIKVPTRREVDWFCLGGHYEECPTYIEKEKEVRKFYKKNKKGGER